MSLRKIAKELGISHTLLVLWRQGKRQLSPELEARYHEVVTTGYKVNASNSPAPHEAVPYAGEARDFKSAASAIPPPGHNLVIR